MGTDALAGASVVVVTCHWDVNGPRSWLAVISNAVPQVRAGPAALRKNSRSVARFPWGVLNSCAMGTAQSTTSTNAAIAAIRKNSRRSRADWERDSLHASAPLDVAASERTSGAKPM